MPTIEQLPPTQQLALRDALHAQRLVLRQGGYIADTAGQGSGTAHPIRTVRALLRAGLLEDSGLGIHLTDEGRAIAEGRA